jgi:hypothetical protein
LINLLRKNAVHTLALPEAETQLWVAALDEKDPWFRFLNWQTQFELTRFIKRKDGDQTIPILYFCGRYLPSKMLLLVAKSESSEWARAIEEKWQHLGSVKTQIFLPENIHRSTFEKGWKPSSSQVIFVEESP